MTDDTGTFGRPYPRPVARWQSLLTTNRVSKEHTMTSLFRSVARAVMAVTISLGVTPPAISLFALLQASSIWIVAFTKRRRVDYARLFETERETE